MKKVTFKCRYRKLNLNVNPGKLQRATLESGQITTIRLPTTIEFRNFEHITDDVWEIKEIRDWMKKHSGDGITEVKK